MSEKSRRQAWIATLLLILFALVRPLRVAGDDRRSATAWLPQSLDDELGRDVALDASEARLARSRRVALAKRRYGPTLATSVVVAGGIREHHPASVCLRASGLEIISRHEHGSPAGCVKVLRVRRGASEATVATTYLSREGEITCSLTRRIAAGAWARLWNRDTRWTQLQVLDVDRHRAVSRIELLIRTVRRRASK